MPNFPRLLYYLIGAMSRLHWNRERLLRYQEKRLRYVIQYAYKYVPFYRKRFKARLEAVPMLRQSLAAMGERQPIASGTGFSLPLSEKRSRLSHMAGIASAIGYTVISTCACKNQVGPLPAGIPMRRACHFHDRWF